MFVAITEPNTWTDGEAFIMRCWILKQMTNMMCIIYHCALKSCSDAVRDLWRVVSENLTVWCVQNINCWVFFYFIALYKQYARLLLFIGVVYCHVRIYSWRSSVFYFPNIQTLSITQWLFFTVSPCILSYSIFYCSNQCTLYTLLKH